MDEIALPRQSCVVSQTEMLDDQCAIEESLLRFWSERDRAIGSGERFGEQSRRVIAKPGLVICSREVGPRARLVRRDSAVAILRLRDIATNG